MKITLNGKDVDVAVTADKVVNSRSKKELFLLGDFTRKASKENYLDPAKGPFIYRVHGFYADRTTVYAKCRFVRDGVEEVPTFPVSHPLHPQPWFYWLPLSEFA
jgi:hypothetical protein